MPAGPTKAERKEQARVEREAIQRRMAASKRNRTIGLSLVALAVVAVIVAVVVLQPGAAPTRPPPRRQNCCRRHPTPRRRPAAPRCRRRTTTVGRQSSPEYADRPTSRTTSGSPLPARQLPEHATGVGPPRGRHDLPAGVYDSSPDLGPLLHSLEHGGCVVWYSPHAPEHRSTRSRPSTDQSDPVGKTA